MNSKLSEISQILGQDDAILSNILLLGDKLGIKLPDRRILDVEIRNGTVNYYNGLKRLLEIWISQDEKQRVLLDLVMVLEEMGCRNTAEILRERFPLNPVLSPAINLPQRNISTTTVIFIPLIVLISSILAYYMNKSAAIDQFSPMESKFDKDGDCHWTWNVLEPVRNFVGRENEIAELNFFYSDEKQRLLVISGTGGQGKTQLCRKWIETLRKLDNCAKIVWLAGESANSFISSIKMLLQENESWSNDASSLTVEKMLQLVMSTFKKEKVIFVIDNVDSEYEEITTFATTLLTKTRESKIVITSRFRTIFPGHAKYLSLNSLSDEAAHQFVTETIGELYTTSDEISILCREMGNHPLALQLSVSFIKSNQTRSILGEKFGIYNFLSIYNGDKLTVLDEKEMLTGYDQTILHIVRISMKHVMEKQGQMAKEIIKILSILRSDGVQFDFLLDIFCLLNPEINHLEGRREITAKVEKALNDLNSISLVSSAFPVITVHPLVQESVRILCPEWVKIAEQVVNKVEISKLSKTNFQHILKLWKIGNKEHSLVKKGEEKMFEAVSKLKDRSPQTVLTFLDSYTEYIRRGNDDKKVSELDRYYALALFEKNRHGEAETVLKILKDYDQKHLEEANELNILILRQKADELRQLGGFDEALVIYQKILPIFVSVYGKNNGEAVVTMHYLAVTLYECRRGDEAEEIENEFIEAQTKFQLYEEAIGNNDDIKVLNSAMANVLKPMFFNCEQLRSNPESDLKEKIDLDSKEYMQYFLQQWLKLGMLDCKLYQETKEIHRHSLEQAKTIIQHPTFSRMIRAIAFHRLARVENSMRKVENNFKQVIHFKNGKPHFQTSDCLE